MTILYRRWRQVAMTAALLFPLLILAPTSVSAATFVNLTLTNGWVNSPFGTRTAGVSLVGGVVTFKGAIATAGTNPSPFILPAGYRPATSVYVPVDLCNATKGRLNILPSGVVTVQVEGAFSNASCFTSLEGASFPLNANGYTALTLLNGWTNAPFGTSNAAVRNIAGIVHFKGAVASGTSGLIANLPVGFRPLTNVYVQVDLCTARKGRLLIQPNGNVTVQTEGNVFANAQCFTSLDGASFAVSPTGFTNLTLQNGWVNAPFGTSNAAIQVNTGIAHFKGAIATTGSNQVAFTLPPEFRPPSDVYVPISLCDATKGRLYIQPSGVVTVSSETSFTNAQCFTSLDGASYAVAVFNPLALQNGWFSSPFSTNRAAVTRINGVVTFRGAIATNGSNPVAFTLPAAYRPTTSVYVPVDLCNATKGRLFIQPSGVVTVQAETSFTNAQCFTSLEGVSYANAGAYTPLALANGWANAPFATSNAGVRLLSGVVHFKGAVANGTASVITTLPVGFRPVRDVYIEVDLCDAKKGRLYIQPNGSVSVQAKSGQFTDAQCFTSLDGASFAPASGGFTSLSLLNGWVGAPFVTSPPAAKSIGNLVYFKGAVGSGTAAQITTLPPYLRPERDTYVPVDLCNATKGRLYIRPDGSVSVLAETAFTDAQCFTSLEGAWFGM